MFYTVVDRTTIALKDPFIFKTHSSYLQKEYGGFGDFIAFESCKRACVFPVPLLMNWWKSSSEAHNAALGSKL